MHVGRHGLGTGQDSQGHPGPPGRELGVVLSTQRCQNPAPSPARRLTQRVSVGAHPTDSFVGPLVSSVCLAL